MTNEPNWPGQPPNPNPNPGEGGQPPTMGAHSTPGAGVRRGEMRFQAPGSTTPRQPPLSEQRARERAEQAQIQREQAELAAIERKALMRRKVMRGAGVTVGLAALVGVGYLALKPDNVTAYCTTGSDNNVANDQYCDDSYVSSHGGYVSGGYYFIPIPGGGYNQYRYYYGGTVSGGRVSGGSYSKPAGENINTRSGKTVQRGGFGLHGGRSSGS